MNFTINLTGSETVRIDLIPPNNTAKPVTPKVGSINLDADDDSECLPLDHYDQIAISDYLESERKFHPGVQPRMPRSITGLFHDLTGKHLVLSDPGGELLAVYRIHADGSMDRVRKVPACIMEAFN